MKKEVNPKDTSHAEAFSMWMSSPMPMVTLNTVNASPYGHEFYKKLGFEDTSEEQITNGVRYYPMKRYTTELPMQALAKGTAKHHYMEMD